MPLTEGIIAGLIANGLTELIRYASIELGSREEINRSVVEELQGDKELETALRKAIVAVAKEVNLQNDRATEKLLLFLISPEAEAIVRQIYGIWLTSAGGSKTESELRTEFTLLMALYLGSGAVEIQEVANELFRALTAGCELALKKSIAKGVLAAHEAKSEHRFRFLADELATIERNLELLRLPSRPDVGEIDIFESKYRTQVASRYAYITPPHFDVSRKIPVKDICVPARLLRDATKGGEVSATVKYDDFLSGFYRGVILGNPGGGKSTLASKICFDLASEYKKRFLAGRQVTPILVILRDYGAAKKQRPISLVQFMAEVSNSSYQIAPPDHSFEYMLLNGRAIVILDGLDELLDTSYRQEISNDIDSFCNLYPAVPTLVTSREVGYEQAPLDQRKFNVFRLAPFDEEQVQQYVRKWFAADQDLTTLQQREKAVAFLEESKIVSDLRSNPLMLALMCNIYRGENYIPRNRPDVYEKCAVMLFEKWDKGRGIFVPLPFESHISPAMKYLAYWIYSEEKLQGGVSEARLVSKAADYLCDWRYEDRVEAEKAARDFIEFCTGRAWVFTDTGTTKEGDKLYQFTHRTFLEYFTAAHLVRTNPTPDELGRVFLEKIARREWDVVAQLAYQLQNKNVEGAGDRLLSQIVQTAGSSSGDSGQNLLSFAARCLEFIVPTPRTVRSITISCVDQVLPKREKSQRTPREIPVGIVGDLLVATDDNYVPMSDSLEKALASRIASHDDEEAVNALALSGRLSWTLREMGSAKPAIHSTSWNLSRTILTAASARFQDLGPKYFEIASLGYEHGIVSLEEILRWHGSAGLFRDFRYSIFPDIFTTSIAHRLTIPAITAGSDRWSALSDAQRIAGLGECGRFLLGAELPWWGRRDTVTWVARQELSDELPHQAGAEIVPLQGDALFGAFALFAGMMAGADDNTELRPMSLSIRRLRSSFFLKVGEIIISRIDQPNESVVEAQLESCGFDEKQEAFVRAWAHGDLILGSRKP